MKAAWYESNGEAKDVMQVGSGRLQHSLLPSFTLDQVVQAHELVEAGQSIGNVVLSMAH